MKRYLVAIILLLSGYLSATTVTGTIQDINGNRYANGTVSAFNLITGASMTPAATDANGSFSITLSPSTYTFTVCAKPVNIGPSTSTSVTQVCAQPATPIVISGGSQDVSTQINAVAPILGPSVAAFLGANNAFTGNNSYAGTETMNGQTTFNGLVALNNILTGAGSAAIAGTFGGSPTMTGNWTLSGNTAFTGSSTFKQFQNTDFYADQYCGGSLDVGLCIINTLAALPTIGGYKYGTIRLDGFQPGTSWVWNTLVTVQSNGVSIIGPGSELLQINASVLTGDHLLIQSSPFTVTQAGTFKGFALLGGSQASAVCMHVGNIIGVDIDDVRCKNFTGAGAAGIWLDNTASNFTERTTMYRVHLDNNTCSLKMTNTSGVSSMGYADLDVRINVNAGQTGLCMSAAADMYHSRLHIIMNGGAGATKTFISLAGNALLIDNDYAIFAEDTGGGGGTFISEAAGSQVTGSGILDVYNNASGNHLTDNILGSPIQIYVPYESYSTNLYTHLPDILATVGANQNSTKYCLQGWYWNGASAADQICLGETLTTAGLNSPSNLLFTHAGSSGAFGIDMSNASVGVGGVFSMGGSPGANNLPQMNANSSNVVSGVTGSNYALLRSGVAFVEAHSTAGDLGLAGFVRSINTVRVASDFTTANNTSLQTITGLSWAIPATAVSWSFTCNLTYSQATASAAVAFGIQAATNNPTAINANGQEGTSLTAFTTGTLRGLATTTATNIVSATPSAFGALGTAADMFNVTLSGTIENPALANTINIMVSTAAGADAVTVYRGGFCQLTP